MPRRCAGSAPTSPDTRFGLELRDLGTPSAPPSSRCSPARFRAAGLCAGSTRAARELARSDLDALTELAKQHGAKGLVWAFVQDGESEPAWRSPIAKFLIARGDRRHRRRGSEAEPGDVVLIVADTAGTAAPGARSPPARAGPALRSDPRRAATTSLDGPFPDVRVAPEERALGRRAPSVHRARDRRRRPRHRGRHGRSRPCCCRAPTTWCSTATRSAAGRFVTIAATCSSACST